MFDLCTLFENVRRQWTGEARRACQIEEREGEIERERERESERERERERERDREREKEREKERKTNPINNHVRMSLCVCG